MTDGRAEGGAVATGEGAGVGVMAGGGYYDHHSATQAGAAARGVELLQAAAAQVDLAGVRVVRVADLGCAQARNSLAPIAAAVDALRLRASLDVDVVHTDLPSNDWATLFDVIEHDPTSYLAGRRDGVHPSVVGRSFYERLFAPATLSLAWTSSTLHWLSRSPGPIADHFFAQSSTDADAIGRYREQSDGDWSAFLANRAVELAPGGSVVFVDVLMGDDGVMGSEALFDALEQTLRAARDAGHLTAKEYQAMAYPTWFRTLAELRAPFSPTFTGSGGCSLELVTLEPTTLEDPFLAAYRASGDARSYGQSQAGFLHGFLGPSFAAALVDHPVADRQAIVDTVFADAATRIAADPDAVSPTYRLVAGQVQRVA